MECLGGTRLQIFLTLFTHATPGTPASVPINMKICQFFEKKVGLTYFHFML